MLLTDARLSVCTYRSGTTSTGAGPMRDTVEAFIAGGRQRRVLVGQHGVLAGADGGPTRRRDPPRRMVGYKGRSCKRDPVYGTPTGWAS